MHSPSDCVLVVILGGVMPATIYFVNVVTDGGLRSSHGWAFDALICKEV